MQKNRRYSESEVSEILERATANDQSLTAPQGQNGLTLAQLQEIGAEVGITADRIAQAAKAVASRDVTGPTKTILGQPRSVSRIIPIDRALTDDEWNRLVVDLRETFSAKGKIESHGVLRSWTNGNLQVHVEPDGDNYRVRMQTVKGDAAAATYSGVFGIAVSVALFVSAGVSGRLDIAAALGSGLVGVVGLAQLGYVRNMLPRWAGKRAVQMEGLAERIPLLLKE